MPRFARLEYSLSGRETAVPSTSQIDPDATLSAIAMASQGSNSSLEGDAAPTPAKTPTSLISETGPDDEVNDAQGTPLPDAKKEMLRDNMSVLMAKIKKLEEEAESNREFFKAMQSETAGRPPLFMGMAPSMNCWDRFFGENYADPKQRRVEFERGVKNKSTAHIDGRKKVMISVLESELEWMKLEDDSFSKLLAERDELSVQIRRLTATLYQTEEKVVQLQRDADAAAKDKAMAELQADPNSRTDSKAPADSEPKAQEPSEAKVAPAPPPEPKFSKPQLNRVTWDLFIANAGITLDAETTAKTFAIDVLEGDPVIAFRYHTPWPYRDRNKMTDENAPAPKKKVFARGQGPLPERIRINSRHILKILQKIDADKFPDGDAGLVMIRPYKALVYYEDQIRKAYRDLKKKFGPPDDESPEDKTGDGEGKAENAKQNDGEPNDPLTSSAVALEQLGVLIQFLDNDIQGKFDYVRGENCQRVSFTDVWYLFRPGDEVIDQRRKQVYRVTGITSSAHKVIPPWKNYNSASAKSDETPVIIHCVYVDYDGKLLGPVPSSVQIPRFEGDRLITSLPVYPLWLFEGRTVADGPNTLTFRQWLIKRGKMFTDVLSVKHMNYNGLTLDTRDEVDGQVMVDFEESFVNEEKEATNQKRINNWRPSVQSLIGIEQKETEDIDCTAGCCTRERVLKDSYAEKKRNEDYINSLMPGPDETGREPPVTIYPQALRDLKPEVVTLTDAEFIIMSYRVFGFILRSRKWAKFDVSYLEYVASPQDESGDYKGSSKPRETAFDQLVMEKEQKMVILSLIAQHFRDKASATAANEQVDIVRGKGKGLIILLHGAPGVGKTSTAEGVAEMFARPLFQITCGDLGTTAESVETSLETHFSLANRWGCILLLDEADVFLAKRTPQDFKRNGLVSVFLRVLEYYAGVLFLTTNRIGDFDEAFGSRIHISLHYPQLTLGATKEIFELNLRLIKQRFDDKDRNLEIEKPQILNSAEKYWNTHTKLRWNGRQIRNACQTALALAEFDAQGGDHRKINDQNAVVKLTVKHLETVSAAYLEFMRYLEKLYKTDQDRLAHKRGYRARELYGSGGGRGKRDASKLGSASELDSEDVGDETCLDPKKNAIDGKDTTGLSAPPSNPAALLSPSSSAAASITASPGVSMSPPNRPAFSANVNSTMGGMPEQVPGLMNNSAMAYMQQAQMLQNMQNMQNMHPAMWQPAMFQGNMPPFLQQPMMQPTGMPTNESPAPGAETRGR